MSELASEEQGIQPLDSMATPKRSEEVWFADGTIVLEADGTLFKAYSGILAHNCEIFRDLLLVPQPTNAETVDGVPLVRLEGTSAADLRAILLVTHSTTFFDTAMSEVHDVVSLLRMSNKYVATKIHKQVMDILEPMFPSKLEQYSSLPRRGTRLAPFDYRVTKANIAIANMAREASALRLLPVALYRLRRLALHTMFDGLPSRAGATAISSILSPVNLRAAILGRARMTTFARTTVLRRIFGSNRAPSRQQCLEALHALSCLYQDEDGFVDPLLKRTFTVADGNGLCQTCKQALQDDYEKGRKLAWDKLPEFFDLPPWEELCRE